MVTEGLVFEVGWEVVVVMVWICLIVFLSVGHGRQGRVCCLGKVKGCCFAYNRRKRALFGQGMVKIE